jgi:hypothetical protein
VHINYTPMLSVALMVSGHEPTLKDRSLRVGTAHDGDDI